MNLQIPIASLNFFFFFAYNRKIREKQIEEYRRLRLEVLSFKKDKLGSNNQELIQMKKEEQKLKSNLEKMNQRYLEKKTVKMAEREKL